MSTIPSADISDKKFFSDDERYADLINGLICQGRPVVRKEDLQDLDTQTGIWNDPAIHKSKNRRRVKLRDLVKKASFGVNFLVIGIENQQTIDYSLPLRCMTYEAGEYERQAAMIRRAVRNADIKQNPENIFTFSKESHLHPSIIIVLYYGELPWRIRRPSRNDRFFRDSGRISSFDSELPDSSCGCPAFTEYRCF